MITEPKPLILSIVEYVIAQMELCVIDYKNGGFLPPEKRAIRRFAQVPVGHLLSKMARFQVLEDKTMLRNKLLVLSSVLRNKYPQLDPAYFSKEFTPKRG